MNDPTPPHPHGEFILGDQSRNLDSEGEGGGGKKGIFSNASFRCLEITKLTGT